MRAGAEDQFDHGGALFKKLSPPTVNPLPLKAIALEHGLEFDEQWSFVGKKSKPSVGYGRRGRLISSVF